MRNNIVYTGIFAAILGVLGMILHDNCLEAGGLPAQKQADANTKSAGNLPLELSDRMVMLAVENELLRSEAVDGHLFDVKAVGGIVTLSGRVNQLLAKQIAVGLALRVRGVKSVIDEIEIAVDPREDAELKKDVRAALLAHPATRNFDLGVSVVYGKATLTGKVPSFGAKTLAGELAMGVKGVAKLENNLQVDSKKKLTDGELQKEISALYRFAVLLDDAEIKVSVKGANVVLNGTVPSAFQRSYAEDLALQAGAKDVDSRGIKVSWRNTNPLLRSERYTKATDKEIGDAIQRAFKYDPRLLSYKSEVQVEKGIVTLTGNVEHLAAKEAAERTARYTIGVRRVNNNLRVRWEGKPPTDQQIADFTRQALRRDPYVEKRNIVVECGNAHVSLYGLGYEIY